MHCNDGEQWFLIYSEADKIVGFFFFESNIESETTRGFFRCVRGKCEIRAHDDDDNDEHHRQTGQAPFADEQRLMAAIVWPLFKLDRLAMRCEEGKRYRQKWKHKKIVKLVRAPAFKDSFYYVMCVLHLHACMYILCFNETNRQEYMQSVWTTKCC